LTTTTDQAPTRRHRPTAPGADHPRRLVRVRTTTGAPGDQATTRRPTAPGARPRRTRRPHRRPQAPDHHRPHQAPTTTTDQATTGDRTGDHRRPQATTGARPPPHHQATTGDHRRAPGAHQARTRRAPGAHQARTRRAPGAHQARTRRRGRARTRRRGRAPDPVDNPVDNPVDKPSSERVFACGQPVDNPVDNWPGARPEHTFPHAPPPPPPVHMCGRDNMLCYLEVEIIGCWDGSLGPAWCGWAFFGVGGVVLGLWVLVGTCYRWRLIIGERRGRTIRLWVGWVVPEGVFHKGGCFAKSDLSLRRY